MIGLNPITTHIFAFGVGWCIAMIIALQKHKELNKKLLKEVVS